MSSKWYRGGLDYIVWGWAGGWAYVCALFCVYSSVCGRGGYQVPSSIAILLTL